MSVNRPSDERDYSTGLVFVDSTTSSRLQVAVILILVCSLPASLYFFLRGFWWLGAIHCTLTLILTWLGLRAINPARVSALNLYAVALILGECVALSGVTFGIVIFFVYEGGWCYGKSYCEDTPPWFWVLSFVSFVFSVFFMLLELYALVLAFRLKREIAALDYASSYSPGLAGVGSPDNQDDRAHRTMAGDRTISYVGPSSTERTKLLK